MKPQKKWQREGPCPALHIVITDNLNKRISPWKYLLNFSINKCQHLNKGKERKEKLLFRVGTTKEVKQTHILGKTKPRPCRGTRRVARRCSGWLSSELRTLRGRGGPSLSLAGVQILDGADGACGALGVEGGGSKSSADSGGRPRFLRKASPSGRSWRLC